MLAPRWGLTCRRLVGGALRIMPVVWEASWACTSPSGAGRALDSCAKLGWRPGIGHGLLPEGRQLRPSEGYRPGETDLRAVILSALGGWALPSWREGTRGPSTAPPHGSMTTLRYLVELQLQCVQLGKEKEQAEEGRGFFKSQVLNAFLTRTILSLTRLHAKGKPRQLQPGSFQ